MMVNVGSRIVFGIMLSNWLLIKVLMIDLVVVMSRKILLWLMMEKF